MPGKPTRPAVPAAGAVPRARVQPARGRRARPPDHQPDPSATGLPDQRPSAGAKRPGSLSDGAGEAYRRLGRHAEAADFHRQAAVAHRALGDGWHEAIALDGLATAVLGDAPEAARRHWTEALRLLADYDDPRAVAVRGGVERRLEGRDQAG